MSDSTMLLELIKKAAVEAVKSGKPSGVLFGTVSATSPLRIQVEQKLALGPAQLVLTRNVTDYTTVINYGDGERQSTIRNGLKTGERVVLLQMQGGQKFIVLDRVVAL